MAKVTSATGIPLTWTRKAGVIIDPDTRRAKVLELHAAHPAQPGERVLPTTYPSLGINALPMSLTAYRAMQAWENALYEEGLALTADARAKAERQARRGRFGGAEVLVMRVTRAQG